MGHRRQAGTDRRLINHSDIAVAAPARFRAGIDDAVIVPLVLLALLARTLGRAALLLVLLTSDLVFAFFLAVLTGPLLLAAATGDGMAWLMKRLAEPLPEPRREAWRDARGASPISDPMLTQAVCCSRGSICYIRAFDINPADLAAQSCPMLI